MERKIGEIFEFKKDWYQCVEGRCKDCHFSEKRFLCKQFITKDFCTHGIIFKKLEKVGEPYEFFVKNRGIILLQKYKMLVEPYINGVFCNIHYEDNTIDIELKQNKEDMEEDREYSEEEFKNNPRFQHHKNIEQVINMKKMKPFNLEQAKAGKPVFTRDGRKARIICFDKRGEQPIVALIKDDEEEHIDTFFNNGHSVSKTNEVAGDLMMLPEKKSDG